VVAFVRLLSLRARFACFLSSYFQLFNFRLKSKMSKLENYRLGSTLGGGTFANVRLAEHKMTGHRVAVKILDKRQIKF
jgi:serine/threonine protein kinase